MTCSTCNQEVYVAENARVIAPGEDRDDPEAGYCPTAPDTLHS